MSPSHICYACRMSEIASRELRNNTRMVLDRVRTGEAVVITVDGRPVAEITPIARRPRWVTREAFAAAVRANQADPGLTADLCDLTAGTTDEIPLR